MLEKTNIAMKRLLKKILVRAQKTKSLAELYSCFCVLQKVEFASDETEYLAEKVSKQNFEGSAWLLLMPYIKT